MFLKIANWPGGFTILLNGSRASLLRREKMNALEVEPHELLEDSECKKRKQLTKNK